MMRILMLLPAVMAAAALTAATAQADAHTPVWPAGAPAPPRVVGAGQEELVVPADQSLREALSGAQAIPSEPYYEPAMPAGGTGVEPSLQAPCALDDSGCVSCQPCWVCRPRWTVSADAVFLTRDDPDAIPFVTLGGDPVFTARDIDFDYETAWRVALFRRGAACDLELAFFGTGNWNETVTVGEAGSEFAGFGITLGVDPYTFQYDHDLYMAEANLWRDVTPCLSVMAGFRYVELNEQLIISSAGLAGAVDASVDNRLYGGQLGGKAIVWSDPTGFAVDVVGKAGIYYNNADYRVTRGLTGVTLFDSDDDLAFLGDLAVTARYPINHWIGIRGGYQLLWIDGVALAPNQSATTDLAAETAVARADDSLFYHGGFVGLEMNW